MAWLRGGSAPSSGADSTGGKAGGLGAGRGGRNAPRAGPQPRLRDLGIDHLSRPLRVGLLFVVGLVLAWALAAAVLFVWPPRHVPAHADAVVVLAGGRGPRLARGLALARRRVAPVLVISDGWSPTWPEANRLCAGRPAPARVVCLRPAEDSTRGEAESFAHLAAARGWRTVVVVSNRYHIARAKMLFERCFKGTVYTADAGESFLTRVLASPFETAKLGYELTLRRSC